MNCKTVCLADLSSFSSFMDNLNRQSSDVELIISSFRLRDTNFGWKRYIFLMYTGVFKNCFDLVYTSRYNPRDMLGSSKDILTKEWNDCVNIFQRLFTLAYCPICLERTWLWDSMLSYLFLFAFWLPRLRSLINANGLR